MDISKTDMRKNANEGGPERLLLVEDVAVHRMLMREGLLRINPNLIFEEASNVHEAKILLFGSEHIDAVICDRSMPEEDGTELVRWMRTMPCFNRVPFVMISGHIDPEAIIDAFTEHRVDNYVVKPFSNVNLYEKLMISWEYRNSPKQK